MTAVRGRVRDGRVELEGELPEGAEVVVLHANQDEDRFDLPEADIGELEARVAAANRGEVVPASEALRRLRSSR